MQKNIEQKRGVWDKWLEESPESLKEIIEDNKKYAKEYMFKEVK